MSYCLAVELRPQTFSPFSIVCFNYKYLWPIAYNYWLPDLLVLIFIFLQEKHKIKKQQKDKKRKENGLMSFAVFGPLLGHYTLQYAFKFESHHYINMVLL